MRFSAVAAIVVLGVLAAVAIAQPAPPAPGPGPRAGGAGGWGANMEQNLDQIATRIGLTEAEKTAAKEAVRAKMQASTALGQELRALVEVVRRANATDEELNGAVQKYEAALAAYRKRVALIDLELSKQLTPKGRAGLLAVGVLDNGLGPRFGGGMRGGMGPGGGGGRRMRMGGGGGTAPTPQ